MVCPCVLSHFIIPITFLGEKRNDMGAFRAFVCSVRVGLCLISLPLGVPDWLRLVTVAAPVLFVLPFCFDSVCS